MPIGLKTRCFFPMIQEPLSELRNKSATHISIANS
jgi:hypothetical protein